MKKEQLEELLSQYLDGQISETDRKRLVELVISNREQEVVTEALQELLKVTEGDPSQVPADWKKMHASITAIDKIDKVVQIEARRIPFYRRRYWAAASILFVLGIAAYFWVANQKQTQPDTTNITVPNDVQAPDKNRAQIKLADGTVLYLDSVGNGELANVNGVKVVKTSDGRIEYTSESEIDSREIQYNTLFNPHGSKVMHMTLADGSHVWLNAGSSITYPVAFTSRERKVNMTGEAYFEVAHNASKPFYVSKGDVSVEVLGTHFNVNAYDDEREIKVTLLEGSVRVQPMADSRKTVVIKPGQQAKVVSGGTSTGSVSVMSGVDLEAVMAWKNGQFSFDNADLKTVMKQIARWYDVEIVYEGALPDEEFNGGTSRQENVSAVLKVLEATGKIKFRVEGKKVFVRK
jgi:transmembrane sensor